MNREDERQRRDLVDPKSRVGNPSALMNLISFGFRVPLLSFSNPYSCVQNNSITPWLKPLSPVNHTGKVANHRGYFHSNKTYAQNSVSRWRRGTRVVFAFGPSRDHERSNETYWANQTGWYSPSLRVLRPYLWYKHWRIDCDNVGAFANGKLSRYLSE